MCRYIKKILKSMVRITPILNIRLQLLRIAGYKIGRGVYIPPDLKISDKSSRTGNLIIGDRVSIGPGVLLITDSSPNNSRLIKKYPLKSCEMTIGDDTWIGAGAIMLPGVNVGQCSIIGAGSVVINDVPPYSVFAGNPAKLISTISPDEL